MFMEEERGRERENVYGEREKGGGMSNGRMQLEGVGN